MAHGYWKGDKVVEIAPLRRRALFPALGRVESYWEGLRDGRLMPMRSEVDPRGIADMLEYAFILERIAPGLARLRLAGMHLNDLMAMEVRGMPLTAMLLPDARREMQRVLEAVLDTPAATRLTLAGDTGFGRAPLEAQMILLPLRDDHGRASRILGALQSRGEIGRGPRRFAIRDVETKPLTGAVRATHPAADTPRPMPQAAKQPAPGHLRLVHDATDA
ncbi:PAS domain-containing protein [Sinisalibacter aestuarii]|uniref:PAS domain-containing protein n=1 Tax=Sinisalibacter aestuarii TaxID=2949426 RepID=A0ABQ5LX70_9RHOB|nr:PAS domain-containing protein [Sinisalibacter aestuarii]GKY88971.1 PAS domain-containing protein [Sinisalibacter aestuarii]